MTIDTEHLLSTQAKAYLQQGDKQKAFELYIQAINANNHQPTWVYHDLGHLFLEKSRVNEAKTCFELLIEKYPNETTGYEELARIAQTYQQWEIALAYWNQCLSRVSEVKVEWLIGKGKALVNSKQYEEADTFSKNLIQYFPDHFVGYAGLAYKAQQQGQWELALTYWDTCIQRFSDEQEQMEDWLCQKAEVQVALAHIDQARSLLEHLIQVYPNSPFAYNRLVELEEQQQNWDKALEYSNKRVEVFSAFVGFYTHLWNLLQEQGKIDRAVEQYQAEIARKPHAPSLYIRLTGVLELQGNLEAALESYQQAKLLCPFPDWLHQRYVNVLIELGKLREAETELRERVADSEQETQLLEKLADLAMRSKQFNLALERWQQLKILQPKHFAACVGEANALIGLNQLEQAKTIFKQLMLDYPDNRTVLENLADIAIRQQDWEAALTCYKTYLLKEPNDFFMTIAKANMLLNLKRLEEARLIYERSAEQFPNKPQGLEGLAKVARLSGDLEFCLECCQQLIERFPGSSEGYREAEQAYIELGQFEKANQMFLANPTRVRKQPKQAAPVFDLPAGFVLPNIVGKNNDYTFIEEKVKQFVESGQPYTLPVSIIIPVYNRKSVLAKTLAALTHQTYPQELIEVVVADDGSSDGVQEVICKYEKFLDLRYVYQKDEGYQVSKVRNLGMRTAKHHHFIILDCDVLPLPQLVESHMRFFHVSDRVVTMGALRYVCSDPVTDDDIRQEIKVILDLPDVSNPSDENAARVTTTGVTYDSRLLDYIKTDYNKTQRWPFVHFWGTNLAHSRAAINLVGGYDEAFQAWGAEDTEMGYRLYNAGYYFIPVMDAVGLHQEPPSGKNETDRQAGKSVTWKLFEEKCPVPLVARNYQPGKIYEVPKVSIYIPAYNAARYIKQAVDSALNQTYTDLEVCICDDGSTDNTLQILEANYGNNQRVRWISQPNGGTAKASNAAVRLCRGMYIGQLDADDLLKPHAVELAVNYLDHHDVGFVYTECEIVDSEGKFVKSFKHSDTFSHQGLLYGNIVGPFRFYRKRDWIRAGGFSEDLATAEDYDLALKMAEVCDLHHINDVNYSYRWHGENTSVVKRKQQEADHFLVINRALQRMRLHEWEAVQAGGSNPRSVKLQKKGQKVSQSSQNKSGINKFIYLIQSDKHTLQYNIPPDADYLLLQWSADFVEVNNSFHFPNSSWAEGRNELYRRAKLLGNYLYFIFLDDDVKPKNFSLAFFQKLLNKHNPKRAAPFYKGHPFYDNYHDEKEDMELVKYVDHMFIACRHDIVEDMLPYSLEYDQINWWKSCEIACEKLWSKHPFATLRFNRFFADNQLSRPYPRMREAENFSYVNPINEAIPYSTNPELSDPDLSKNYQLGYNIALIIIFNHRYDANLPLLREIYREKFSCIRFLMPFYDGTEEDVIPYFAHSHHFQLAITQALLPLQALENITHYFFIADDLILNPKINQDNMFSLLGGKYQPSIPTPINLLDESAWFRKLDIINFLANAKCGGTQYLIPSDEMSDRITKLGFSTKVNITAFRDEFKKAGYEMPMTGEIFANPAYPLLASYSDIFIIPKNYLKSFAHYCGVFGAMQLFVEVAIPSACLMVSKKLDYIEREESYHYSSIAEKIQNKGLILWEGGIPTFCEQLQYDFKRLFQEERKSTLFIHPVKLTQWKNVL